MKWYSVVALLMSMSFCAVCYAQVTPQSALDEGNVAQAAEILTKLSADTDAERAVEGLCGKAQLAMEQGNLDEANKLVDEAIVKVDELKRKNGWHVVVLWFKAELARKGGDNALSRKFVMRAQEAIDNGAKVGDGWSGHVAYLYSLVEPDNGDARDAAEEAESYFASAGMSVERGHACLQLAELEWARGKDKKAYKAYDAAIKSFNQAKDGGYWVALTHLEAAAHLAEQKSFDAAKKRIESANKLIAELGNPRDLLQRVDAVDNLMP